MQIFVKTISGDTITLDVSEIVDSVKTQIEQVEGIPSELQRLMYGASELQNGRFLAQYGVRDKATIQLTLSLQGGYGYDKLLAYFHNLNKMICRKCYGQLPPRATRCRRARCGRTTDLRPKKTSFVCRFGPEFKPHTLRGFIKSFLGQYKLNANLKRY